MKQHEKNAKKIAVYLQQETGVTDVLYPGKGGMLSFRLKESSWVDPFLKNIELITFAESLGRVESFVTYPTTQKQGDIPEEITTERGVCERLERNDVA